MTSGIPSAIEPRPDLQTYRTRRARIATALGDGALLAYAGDAKTRSADTEYRYRPDSDFFYLTGLAEPGAVLVMRPGRDPEVTLFVRPKDADAEIWSGRRIGPEAAKTAFGCDEAYPISELSKELPKLLDGVHEVHVPLGSHPRLERATQRAIDHLRRRNRLGESPPEVLRDARVLLGEDRIVKDESALASLRRAAEVTVHAHVAAMKACRPGLGEYEIEALLEYEFRRRGSSGPGYGSIVGAGDNATILHYVDNDARMTEGTLLLVDAGAEWNLMSADLTRTYPVSGRFRPGQRDLYEVVLAANEAGIAAATVGQDIDAIHQRCVETLTRGMLDLGLLEGTVEQAIESESYKRFYMHRTSHWLGADVHDAGYYCIERRPRPLAAGFVLTIEPGIYVPADAQDVPEAFRGCGIRIEDDVLVREDGPEVLTHAAPKTVSALEAVIGSGPPPR